MIGTGEPGATVRVFSAAGAFLAQAVVEDGGAFSVTLPEALTNGEQLTVDQVDEAGNESTEVGTVAPDLTRPDAPSAAVSTNGEVVTGVGEPGALIRVFNASNELIGEDRANELGEYSVTLDEALINRETVSVVQVDGGDNVSLPATAVAPDLTPPDPPIDLAVSADGTVVTGAGEIGAEVEVRSSTGGVWYGVVDENGRFEVPLDVAQVAGQTLTVILRDEAENPSFPEQVTAPFDIDAFDNVDEATIDLIPVVTEDVAVGSQAYAALVSLGLLDLQAEVLGTDVIEFNVAAGHVLDAELTFGTLIGLGLGSSYVAVIQRWNGSEWVSVDGSEPASVIELQLLGNNSYGGEQTLTAGQYRAFATYQGPGVGVALVGGLTIEGTRSDYTDGDFTPIDATGNVITDPGPGNAVDIVSPQTVVNSVTFNNVTTTVEAGGTTINGQFGTLFINAQGDYTYTPTDPAAIGKTEVFEYELRDGSDDERERATLTINIDGDDIQGPVTADGEVAEVEVRYANDTSTIAPAIAGTITAPLTVGVATGSTSGSFNVVGNVQSDVTIFAVQAGLTLTPDYTVVVTRVGGGEVFRGSGTALLDLGLGGFGAGRGFTVPDLSAGQYNYTVTARALLTGFTTTVLVGQEITHLDRFDRLGETVAEGNLLENDQLGSLLTRLEVSGANGFVTVGDTPVVLNGQYGSLTVNRNGDYTYDADNSLTYTASDLVDSFTYRLVRPDGTSATATLQVNVDNILELPGNRMMSTDSDADDGNDVVALSMVEDVGQHDYDYTAHEDVIFERGMLEMEGSVEDVLGRYLDSQPATELPIQPSENAVPTDVTTTDQVYDPTNYIVLQTLDTDENHHNGSI